MNDPNSDDPFLTVAAEELRISKVKRARRRVVVRTETSLTSRTEAVEATNATVEIKRVPIGRDVDAAPVVRVEGDVTIVPVLSERPIVTKQLVLKEEIHIRTLHETRPVEFPMGLRQQTAIVERFDIDTGVLLSQEVLQKDQNHDE